ncbi:MAG: potassium channel family protein [Methanoregula sp.]
MVSSDSIRDGIRQVHLSSWEGLGRLRQAESGLKYILLCLYITISIFILPFLGIGMEILVSLFILIAVTVIGLTYLVKDAGDVRILILLLAFGAVVERLTLSIGRTDLRIFGLAITLVLVGVLTIFCIFAVVLARNPVRAHIIWAAISVYLLFGILFAIAFEILGTITRGSIIYMSNPAQVVTTSDYIYYSYSTLFTLSYGDYVPLGSFARSLALLEVLFGLFFMGIIIAKLVGFTGLPGYDKTPDEAAGNRPENDGNQKEDE